MADSAFTQGILTTPLPTTLGGTGLSTIGSSLQVLRVNAGATALEYATVGALTDGDKGDITVSASGATWTIDNLAVTNAKINDVAWSKVTGAPSFLTANQTITLSGDVTGSGTTGITATLATVNANVGSFGSSTQASTFTVNAKGLITAASNVTVTPAVGSITGLGTNVATALAVNVGSAGAFVTFNGALGTPSSGTVTNLTGTASININGTVGATTPNTGSFTTVTTTGNIELGNASDTTFARAAAGIYSVEGTVQNGYATTATAAGTTTLTIASARTQFFTGTTTQTVTLPTTSILAGQEYRIENNSTGNVTVQSSGANTVQILGAGMSALFTALVATPTTAANWDCVLNEFQGLNIAQTASANAATVNLAFKTNTITNNSAATLTITFPTAGAIDGETRIVRILDFSAVAQTLTLVNTQNSKVTPEATTNGSTTSPYTIGVQFNGASSLWRVIAAA